MLDLGMDLGPGADAHLAVLVMQLGVLGAGRPPTARILAGELRAMPSGSSNRGVPRLRLGIEAAVAAHPYQHRHVRPVEVSQVMGERADVIAGIEDAQRHGSVGCLAPDQLPDLSGGHGMRIAVHWNAPHIQWGGPTLVSEAQLGQPGVRPASHDRLPGGLAAGRVIEASLGLHSASHRGQTLVSSAYTGAPSSRG
jgi:hypothetical protein